MTAKIHIEVAISVCVEQCAAEAIAETGGKTTEVMKSRIWEASLKDEPNLTFRSL